MRCTFETQGMNKEETKIEIQNLTMAYGSYVVMRDITARVKRGSIFVIMGNSGSGKSTLLRHMIGLQRPVQGDVLYDGKSFWAMEDEERRAQLRKYGVLFQSGALWSSMTLAENVALPLVEYTEWSEADRADIVRLKLALVGLNGFEDYYPAAISGGMRKRAGLARAMALDPEILFFDEPSAGLDPSVGIRHAPSFRPEETAEGPRTFQPSLRDFEPSTRSPTLKRWAIVKYPYGIEFKVWRFSGAWMLEFGALPHGL